MRLNMNTQPDRSKVIREERHNGIKRDLTTTKSENNGAARGTTCSIARAPRALLRVARGLTMKVKNLIGREGGKSPSQIDQRLHLGGGGPQMREEEEEWQSEHRNIWLQKGEAVPQAVELGQRAKGEEQEGLKQI